MARGFLTGALIGLVVAGTGAAVMSVLLGPAPTATAPSVGDGAPGDLTAGTGATPQTASVAMPDPATTLMRPSAPPGVLAETDAEPMPQTAENAAAPQAETRLAALSEPDAATATPDTGALSDPEAPSARATSAGAISSPNPETQPQVSQAPLQAPSGLDADTAAGASDTSGAATPGAEPEPLGAAIAALPVPEPLTPAAPQPSVPSVETAPPAAAAVPVVPAPAATPQGETTEDNDRRLGIGRPATTFAERRNAGSQARLPQVGGVSEAAVVPAFSASSPLVRYAATSDADPALPRIAIVLIDDGQGPWGPEALQGFPFPVSFAIAPSHPDPATAAAGYRALGFEVLALASVPEGARATDVEVSLQASLAAVPEAVAVLEDPLGGLQSSRDVTTQVTQVLLDSGHGLVMVPKGLNTAQQLAAREGVPSVSLFRDFDGKGQDRGAIRRFLDQAAFKARQDGAVTMLGRVKADTISALVQWGLQDRTGTVSLVPVSVVLRESQAS